MLPSTRILFFINLPGTDAIIAALTGRITGCYHCPFRLNIKEIHGQSPISAEAPQAEPEAQAEQYDEYQQTEDSDEEAEDCDRRKKISRCEGIASLDL